MQASRAAKDKEDAMNHDDNINTTHSLAPELEARVVAWVAGEASAFEAAELERLTTTNPELAIFKRRMQAVHGLVAEAVQADKDLLRLSPERRGKLLRALGVTENQSQAAKPKRVSASVVSLNTLRDAQRKYRGWILAIAACLIVGLLLAMSLPRFQKVRLLKSGEVSLVGGVSADSDQSFQLSMPTVAEEPPKASESGNFGMKFKSAGREERIAALAKKGREIANSAVQQQKEEDEEEGRSGGYKASNTLAGTRMAPKLQDFGSSVSVATKDVLRDLGATDKQSLLGYTGNSEGAGAQGNFDAPAAPAPSVAGQLESQVTANYLKPEVDKTSGTVGDEVVVLSPFSVSKSTDQTYAAQQMRAGARIRGKTESLAEDSKLDDCRVENEQKPAETAKKSVAPSFAAETITAKEPVSTFSLHVSDVSFKIAKEALANDSHIDRERIRPEEFYNAFNYGDPSPVMAEKIACRIEQAAHPFLQQRNLVRISMKVAAAGRGAGQPLRLTVLLDTSGSMEREDRAAAVRGAMQSLVSLLGPNDQVTLIGFARQPRLLAESVAGDQAGELLKIIASTPSEGGTNLEEALKLAQDLAKRHFEATAQNRIVLLTDGAANLGNADPSQLAASIEALRQEGIAFDACGVGMEGLDDAMLETLSRKGDGRYYVLNSAEDADAGFARQLAGALRPAAKDVKLQVRFNPARVRSYRLIGFEKHRLREEDFRNDKVDAAELAAEEAAVAVYQVEPLPQGEGELGEVYVRFLDPATGNRVERSWTLPYDAKAPSFDRASPTLQLAGTAALLAETLQRGEEEDAVRLNELAPVVNGLRGHFPGSARVDDLVAMFAELKKQLAE
jgi:secreted protein with Ig-like and vWFA domain